MNRRDADPGAPGDPGNHEPRQRFHTPDASPRRRAVEQHSAPALLALRRAPRWFLPLVAIALLLAGLTAPGWAGGPALIGLAALLGWLAYLSWPSLGGAGRVLRAAALAILVGLATLRLLGRY